MSNLTDEEKLNLINDTKKLVEEYNILSMDIETLRDQLSKVDVFKRLTSTEYKKLYHMLDRQLNLKCRRLLVIDEKIEKNKELLGISEVKKKKKKK